MTLAAEIARWNDGSLTVPTWVVVLLILWAIGSNR
jgi:hypothetical protein